MDKAPKLCRLIMSGRLGWLIGFPLVATLDDLIFALLVCFSN
jgi:hypothetical protein